MVKLICCGQEMILAGPWAHCRKCGARLLGIPIGTEPKAISSLLYDYIQESMLMKKELDAIMTEIWRAATYEDYDSKLEGVWEPFLPDV